MPLEPHNDTVEVSHYFLFIETLMELHLNINVSELSDWQLGRKLVYLEKIKQLEKEASKK